MGIIEASRAVIAKAPLLPYYEKKFQNEALIRAVHYGTHIEGNELDLSQAERVVMGQQVIARERDIKEVINYRRVMDYIGQWGQQVLKGNIQTLDEALIMHLHRLTVEHIMPAEVCGTYRTSQVVIKSSLSGEVVFRPPLPPAVPLSMADLLTFINTTTATQVHPVLQSAIVHYEFVRIHPFLDGNGRVARALSTLILFRHGYDIRRFFSLEEYFDSDASRYYAALQSVEKAGGDMTEWLTYFTEGLAIELGKIRHKVETVSVDAKLKEKMGGEPYLLSERQLAILEYIQKTGYIENKIYESLFPMVSEDTILIEMQKLVKAGILQKKGKTKGVKYILAAS